MMPARMGKGDGLWQGKQSRGDSILWITQGLRAAGELPEVTSLTAWQLLADRATLYDSLWMAQGLRVRAA